jgi:hypothetical protein
VGCAVASSSRWAPSADQAECRSSAGSSPANSAAAREVVDAIAPATVEERIGEADAEDDGQRPGTGSRH